MNGSSTVDILEKSSVFIIPFITTISATIILSLQSTITPTISKCIRYVCYMFQSYRPYTTVHITCNLKQNSKPTNSILITAILHYIREKSKCSSVVDCILDKDYKTLVIQPFSSIIFKDYNISCSNDNEYMRLAITSKLPTEKILKFIETCNEYYGSINTSQLYYYTTQFCKDWVNRYPYSISTTFDNMYFPEKLTSIQLLDDLTSGKIDKLVFLLHGHPGTGKTSFIKATINYTRRHIININPSDIIDDQLLKSLFFLPHMICSRFPDTLDKIPFENRLYAIEEFDVDTSVNRHTPADTKTTTVHIKDDSNKSSLNIKSFLTLFDGVIALPKGTLIIITTNFPEKIDPALLRPGRVDKIINFQNMTSCDATSFIRTKYPDFNINIPDYKYTIAELSNYIKVSKTYEEFCNYIK